VHALNGVATFSVTGAAAGPLGLTATSAGLTSGVTAFTVVPGAADHLAFTSASNDLASGSTRNLTVEVRDASGNHVSSSADVMFTRTSGPGTVTGLPATVTASGGDASHQVTGFLGGPITITASAPALGSGSTSFKIAPGPKRRRLTLRRSGLALSGRVTSRSLVCRARVPLRIEVTPKGKRPETLKRMKTTKAGGFRVRFRKSGVYRVVVPVAPGCAGVRSKATRLRSAAGR
jgi:hypothetical protein